MKQILSSLILVFLFFGCTPKQTIELKTPQKKDPTSEIIIGEEITPDDTITIIEEYEPLSRAAFYKAMLKEKVNMMDVKAEEVVKNPVAKKQTKAKKK